MTPEELIQTRLENDADVVEVVGPNVFHIEPPEGVLPPYITYHRTGTEAVKDLHGVSRIERAELQVDYHGDDSEVLQELGKRVRAALDGYPVVFFTEKSSDKDFHSSQIFHVFSVP